MNLNPFYLNGPQFLVFYILFTAAIAFAAYKIRQILEHDVETTAAANATELASKPYETACLRAGPIEAIRVAVLDLLDKGALLAKDKDLQTSSIEAVEAARHPLEKAILTMFFNSRHSKAVYNDPIVLAEAQAIQNTIERMGLRPDDDTKSQRRVIIAVAIVLLFAIGLIRIVISLLNNHTNLIYLLILMALSPFLILYVTRREHTALGRRTLDRLQERFAAEKEQAAALQLGYGNLGTLAAVFGIAALPIAVMAASDALAYTPPRPNWWNTSTGNASSCSSCSTFSSCGSGSSCSSTSSCSSGSSCGSSCGGGGCGGGGCS